MTLNRDNPGVPGDGGGGGNGGGGDGVGGSGGGGGIDTGGLIPLPHHPPAAHPGRHPGTGKPSTTPKPTTTPLPPITPNIPRPIAPTIMPRPNLGAPPSRSDTVLPITQPLPVIYGNAVSCGGQIIYDHVLSTNQRLVVYAVCWGPVNAISNITVDGKTVSTTVYTGTAAQSVDSNLAADNANWTSGLPGIAYVVIKFASPTTTNPPPDITRFLCDVQGMLVRDPRTDPTLVNRYYRDNPALILADYLTSSRFGGSIADAQVDFAGSVTDSANDCDALLVDGITKRFVMGIRMDATRGFEDWKETLRAHAELNVVYNNGLYQVWMDKAQSASSVVFTDTGSGANIIDAGSLTVRGIAQSPTRVKVNFFNATTKKPDVAQDEDPGIVTGLVELVETTYDLQGIKAYDQARRVARYLRKRASFDQEATLSVMQDGGVQVLPGVVVTVTALQLGWTSQLALVTQCSASGGIWTVTVEIYNAALYDDTQVTISTVASPTPDAFYVPQSFGNGGALSMPDAVAAVGGRLIVAVTNKLTANLGTGDTTISVERNNLASGDRIYLESAPLGVAQAEYMAVTSGASGTGPYTYTVTRDLASTGAKSWLAVDALVSTGQTGSGFIDAYSVRGIKSSSEHGPSIVGNVRASSTYNDWTPRWAIGNLNGLYGYATDIYGCAFGVPSGAWIKIDPTNGVRIGHNTFTKVQIDASGNASFTGAITATSGSFTGEITATSGTIGGWTIGSSSLSGSGSISAASGAVVIDSSGISIGTTGRYIVFGSSAGWVESDGSSLILGGGGSGGGNLSISGGGATLSGGLGGSTPYFNAAAASGYYAVNGTPVVGAQGAAVADSTDVTNVATQLNALLARLRTHGLIA